MSPSRPAQSTDSDLVLGTEDASLLEIVDNVLNKGVVLSGDLTIALANVDLIYARLSVLLCAADRVLPPEENATTQKAGTRRPRRLPPPGGLPPPGFSRPKPGSKATSE